MSCENLTQQFNVKLSTGSGNSETTMLNQNFNLSETMSVYWIQTVYIAATASVSVSMGSISNGTVLMVVPDTVSSSIGIKINSATDALECYRFFANVAVTSVTLVNSSLTVGVTCWVLLGKLV